MDVPARRRILRRLASVLLGATLLLPLGAAGQNDLDRNRRSLEEIQRRIEQTSRSLEEKRSAERSAEDELRHVEQELTTIRSRINLLDKELARLRQEVAAKTEETERLKGQVLLLEARVKKRLVALYKGGEGGFLRLLFSGGSPSRLAEDYIFLGRVVRRDREMLSEYRGQVARMEQALAELAQMRRRQQDLLAAARKDRENLTRAQKLQGELLAQLHREQTALGKQLAELRQRAEQLDSLIKKLESERPREYTRSGLFAAQKGRLPWPIRGDVRVGFGTRRHPELGTMYDSQGIEIAVAGEKPIAAVWQGKVVFASWFKGYGNLLILDHGDNFYTLYAQASRLLRRVGDQVGTGDVLAFSGYPDARGVYFEIRAGSTPLDPAAWLATP